MNNNSEFDNLMEAVESDQPTAEQAARISELLCTDPDFRTRYLQYMAIRGQLAVAAKRAGHFDPAAAAQTDVANPSRRNQRTWIFLIAVAALVAFILPGYWYLMNSGDDDAQLVTEQDAGAAIAEVTSQNGYWHCSGLNAEVGELLEAGRWLRLNSGTANLRFSSGVEMTLIEDTLIQMISESRILLVHGEARTTVPENATGFTIATAAGDVVDLGTEFSVATLGSELDVHVHDGLARIDAKEIASQLVNEGDTFRVNPVARIIEPIQPLSTTDGRSESELHIAYQVRANTFGNQAYPGKVAHDFVVLRPIAVTRLGIFDSESDGLTSSMTCELWRRDTRGTPQKFDDDVGEEVLATVEFEAGSEAELSGAHRMLPLEDGELILEPGSYSMIAFGFSEFDPNENDWEDSWRRVNKNRDDGNGAIEFVGTSRYGSPGTPGELDANSFPLMIDDSFADRYAAGTFEFRLVE